MINMHTTVSGRYRVSVKKPDGTTRNTDWFDNLITDGGLDDMHGGGYLNVCAVGTDSTAPAFTDTQLGGLLASTGTRTNNLESKQVTTSPYYTITQNTYTFSQGAVVGNVAEVGVGAASTDLFSRALVLDGSGNPTTITVLSDEILIVEYELRIEIPETDTTGSFTDGGTTYNWTARAADIDNPSYWEGVDLGPRMVLNSTTSLAGRARAYDGSIGTIFQTPSGSTGTANSGSPVAYATGSSQASGSFTFSTGSANSATGITAITFTSQDQSVFYQVGISPAIMKTADDQLTFTVSYSWGRK